MKKLSVIIPCYNEEKLIREVIIKVIHTPLIRDLEKEVIVVDDGSGDQTSQIITSCIREFPGTSIVLCQHGRNKGKGASIRTALEKITGDIVIIQDADLEYDPRDYNGMLEPVLEGYADVVYGSRFMGTGPHRVLFYFHTIGNKFLTMFSNLFTQLNLTDMETGYKMFAADLLKKIKLEENRFGFEPEVTAKISRIKNIRIYETGIRYYGRTYQDGKKIKWQDGFHAVYCILKYNLFSRK